MTSSSGHPVIASPGIQSQKSGILDRPPLRTMTGVEHWEGPMAGEKIAIVTGAGTGVGRAAALALMREGYTVVLAGRRQDMLDAVAKEGAQTPGAALTVQTDVADPT